MRRYWVPKEFVEAGEVRISGDVLHHIRDVCRMHLGSKFEILVEGGEAHLVEITEEAKNFSRARILETRKIPELSRPHLHLAMSIPRFPVFEAVLEKAVELGVHSIHPFYSDFSFVRKKDDVLEKKAPRWQKIIQSATQQSGRGDWLKLHPAENLKDILEKFNRSPAAGGLFAYEGEGVLGVKEGIAQIKGQLKSKQPQEVWLFVGSEGGFSHQEVQTFQQFGLGPVTMGSQVLRVETACVAMVSIIKYDFDQMQ